MEESNKLEIEIISRETITPSSPTPHHLRHFHFSIYDQLSPSIYVPLVFFYPNVDSDSNCISGRHLRLKSSLSETLTRFYPLAGRIVKDELFIDCNDAGADYLEAKVIGRNLSDILQSPCPKQIYELLPVTTSESSPESGSGHLLLVQANLFQCGGMVIGACFSHKITDSHSVMKFMKEWAAAAARGTTGAAVPEQDLNIASYFPAIPATWTESIRPTKMTVTKCRRGRFVFDASNLAALRAKAASATVKEPTRVEVVSGIIWKCIINALRSKFGHLTKPCMMGQSVNIRTRMEPPLPEYSMGNSVGAYSAKVEIGNDHNETELQGLVQKLRKGLEDLKENYVKKIQGDEGWRAVLESRLEYATIVTSRDIDFYAFTSWCRSGLYDVDFGWGKPAWVNVASSGHGILNLVVLMDSRDGHGIEAWVSLPEEDMTHFKVDPELLEFASPNPSVLRANADCNRVNSSLQNIHLRLRIKCFM